MSDKGFCKAKGVYHYMLGTEFGSLSDTDMFSLSDDYYVEFEVKHHNTRWKEGNTFLTKKKLDHFDFPAFSIYAEITRNSQATYVDGKITAITNPGVTRIPILFLDDCIIVDVVFNNKCTEELKDKVKFYKGLTVGCFLTRFMDLNK